MTTTLSHVLSLMPFCSVLSIACDSHMLEDESLNEADRWFDKFSMCPDFWDNYGQPIQRPQYLKHFAPWIETSGISDCASYEEALLRNEIACNKRALDELKLLREFDKYIESKRTNYEHIGKEQEKAI